MSEPAKTPEEERAEKGFVAEQSAEALEKGWYGYEPAGASEDLSVAGVTQAAEPAAPKPARRSRSSA